MTVRRDRRGRRIGYNWWREYNMGLFLDLHFVAEQHREDNHQMEPDEYSAAYPLPQLKVLLVQNKGMNQPP